MKIALTLDEIWALQDIQRKGICKPGVDASAMIDAGLISEYYQRRGWKLMVTDLGKRVLEQNLPVIIGDYSSLLPIIRPIRLKPKLRR